MKKKYEPVKCIQKGELIEIHNTFASKSSICKSFGARWNPTEKVWTWEPSHAHPTFVIEEFIKEYNCGAYNEGSKPEYWAHRKQVDKLKADIEKEKEQWRQGQVPIDEHSEENVQKEKRQTKLCKDRQDKVFAYSYGAMPCDCKTCIVNKVFKHQYFQGERHMTIGYIIGEKEEVEKIRTKKLNAHRYIYRTEPTIGLGNGRAVALYSLYDTSYE